MDYVATAAFLINAAPVVIAAGLLLGLPFWLWSIRNYKHEQAPTDERNPSKDFLP